MTENLEQHVEETTPSLMGAPGMPGEIPKYLEVFPPEASHTSTKYDNKNAIWDSEISGWRHKNVSFATPETALQFRAHTYGDSGPTGSPMNPDSTHVYLRVKRDSRPYDPWYQIHHTGNLDKSTFALETSVDAKANKSYVDSELASKASRTYVNSSLASKASQTYVDSEIAIINEKLDTKVNTSDHPRINCAGYVNPEGNIQSSGQGVRSLRLGVGEYRIYPLSSSNFTGLYTVNAIPDSLHPNKICTVSGLCSDYFDVHINSWITGKAIDSGFQFIMVQY